MLKAIGLASAVALAASFTAVATPADAGTYTQLAIAMVRSSVPAEAYFYDHNTYAGMTIAKLRGYDRRLSSVEVARATKGRYCLQTNVLGSWAHYAGPSGGTVRVGRC